MLSAIAYVSTAVSIISDEKMERLLQDARANNIVMSVTGVLLFKDGFFFQYLEGPTEALGAVYERVLASSSHTRVHEFLNAPILEREFSSWSMGFFEQQHSELLYQSQLSWTQRKHDLDSSPREKSDGILFLHSFIRAQRSEA